jgi:hypothetical protein
MKLTRENRRPREGKTFPSATLPTTNPTLTNPGSNPGLRGERPANRQSHGTALYCYHCPFCQDNLRVYSCLAMCMSGHAHPSVRRDSSDTSCFYRREI